MLESIFSKVADLQACNVIKKKLQHEERLLLFVSSLFFEMFFL